jgi:hypothetical protein
MRSFSEETDTQRTFVHHHIQTMREVCSMTKQCIRISVIAFGLALGGPAHASDCDTHAQCSSTQVCASSRRCEDPFVQPLDVVIRAVKFAPFWKGAAWDERQVAGLLDAVVNGEPGDVCGNGGAAPDPAVLFGVLTGGASLRQLPVYSFVRSSGGGPGREGVECNSLQLSQIVTGRVTMSPYDKIWIAAFDYDRAGLGTERGFDTGRDFQSLSCESTALQIVSALRDGQPLSCKSDYISFEYIFGTPYL